MIHVERQQGSMEDSAERPHYHGPDMEHPTSHTSYLNMDRARLMYGLIMQMDMDMGNMISMQDYLDSSVQYIQARLPRSDHCLMQRSGS